MKAFVAYRHTGEKTEYLEQLLGTTNEALREAGVDAYCTFFDEDDFQSRSLTPRDIMEHAFSKIDASDMLFVIQTSENKSEGMLMEVGYCIAKGVPIVVAVNNAVEHTYLPDMANLTLHWDDLNDLKTQIQSSDFEHIVNA